MLNRMTHEWEATSRKVWLPLSARMRVYRLNYNFSPVGWSLKGFHLAAKKTSLYTKVDGRNYTGRDEERPLSGIGTPYMHGGGGGVNISIVPL